MKQILLHLVYRGDPDADDDPRIYSFLLPSEGGDLNHLILECIAGLDEEDGPSPADFYEALTADESLTTDSFRVADLKPFDMDHLLDEAR